MNVPTAEDYRLLFQASPTPFLVLTPAFTIVGVSDSYLRATMTRREDILDKGLFEVFPDNPNDPTATGVQNLRNSLNKVLETGQPDQMAVQKYDVRRPADEGGQFEERHWSPLNTPVFNSKGEIIYIIHRVEDVTEMVKMSELHEQQQLRSRALEKKSELMEAELSRRADQIRRTNAELEFIGQLLKSERTSRSEADESWRANRLKSQFLASMSHELRTPLNAIIGFSDLLADETAGPLTDKQKRFVGHVRDGSRHLLELINDILDLSKIEAGSLELHRENFSLAAAMPEVLSIIRPLAMAKKIRVEDSAGDLRVEADRVRFKQILYNLLSNAVKFTPEGGEIRVESTADGKLVSISVTDTGVGIRPEDQQVIFEEFRQVGETTRGVKEGTGLGLAITKRLVEQQGGTVRVESEPGHGSRFSFTLPAGQALQEPAPEQPITIANAADSAPVGVRPVILVVDDEPSARELIAGYLEPAGFATVVVGSGAEAIAKARQSHPSVITLDILMPGGSGFETLFQLKNTPETANIPIIVVSVVDQKQMGFTLGAAEYLMKPVKKAALQEAVRKHVRPHASSNVLVVDDDRNTLDLVSSILRSAGYTPHAAPSGKDAFQLLSAVRMDAILLDLIMPEMDGFEILRKVKEDPVLGDIPVFVITAKDLTDGEIELLKRETSALFRKSGSWKADLLAQVRKAVG